MARINLLPWRETLRQARKQQFFMIVGAVVLVALVILFMGNIYIHGRVTEQEARNRYLQAQITQLDMSISEIGDLKLKRTQLLERMEVIQNLQGDRPVIVRVFDQIPKIVPDGVYLKELQLENRQLSLIGASESNNRISALMRNFDESNWFDDPNLTAVRKIVNEGQPWNEFDLTIRRVNPKAER